MAKIRSGDVQVEGLAELNRALRLMDAGLQAELKAAGLKVAEFVAADARAVADTLGGVARKTAPSITAKGYTTGAGVSFGGASYPFAGGAEFGSYKYHQFKPWRGNSSDAGYFLYPAIRQDVDRIETEYGNAIDDLIRKVGLR